MKSLALGLSKALVLFGYSILHVLDNKLFQLEWGKTRQEVLAEAVSELRTVSAHEAKISWLDTNKKKGLN